MNSLMGRHIFKSNKKAKNVTNSCVVQKMDVHNHFNSNIYDKFSWSVGTNVMVPHNDKILSTIIKEIEMLDDIPRLDDKITVVFLDGEEKQFKRYELKSSTNYIQNRHKLRPGCLIEIQSKANQWKLCYINNWGLTRNNKICTNGGIFSVNGQNYDRWSHKLRCCSDLLKLEIGANIYIFDLDINKWCYGTIQYIFKSTNKDLDIYYVYYRKNGKIYSTYIHQFSAKIQLPNPKYLIHNDDIKEKTIYFNETELIYYKLLLQKFVRAVSDDVTEILVNNDILSVLIEYVGFVNGLIMILELKTWKAVMKHRDRNFSTQTIYETGSFQIQKYSKSKPIKQHSKSTLNVNANRFIPNMSCGLHKKEHKNNKNNTDSTNLLNLKVNTLETRINEILKTVERIEQKLEDDEKNQNNITTQIENIKQDINFLKNNLNGNVKVDKTLTKQQKLKVWLRDQVELPEYYDIFIENGVDDLSVVMLINMDVLQQMDIKKIGHKMKILHCVKLLKQEQRGVQNNDIACGIEGGHNLIDTNK
eukprot:235511_1